MAEFLKTISCWEGGKGRGMGAHADSVSSTPSHGSGEMRPVSLGCVGIGRGIQSNFPDGGGAQEVPSPGKSKAPADPGTAKDTDPVCPTRSNWLVESYKEWVPEQKNSEAAVVSTGQAGGDGKTQTIPEPSVTSITASENPNPPEPVLVKDPSPTPNPPGRNEVSEASNAGTNHSTVPPPVASSCEVLMISEYINPLQESLDFDVEQNLVGGSALLPSHASSVTAAFLPGVHHPQRDQPRRPSESDPSFSVEPTLANILHHTFQLLSQRPGTFIGVMPALVSILKVNLREEQDVEEVIDSLCFASITDENFRYNGARVCTHLATELKSFRFMEHLLERCRREFDRGLESVWFGGEWSLYGKVSLFIGELMVQLEAELGQPSEILVRFVVHLLDRLLCFDNEALLKCLVQLLKLTGARLNEIVRSDLCRIMTEIRQSVLLKASSRKSRELLLSVVELDARGWMKDEEEEVDAGNGDGVAEAAASSLLSAPEEAKDVNGSSDNHKVVENGFHDPQESAPDASDGNNELDDLVDDLTEDERTGLEIAQCYEDYLVEIGEE